MDRQYTLCVLVPAHQYRSYLDNYHHHQQQTQEHQRRSLQRPTYVQYQQQQQRVTQQHQQYQEEQIYENIVSQYRMRMCYHNDYENDEQIQRFYWEQCYKRDDADATAYYYCEYVRNTHLGYSYKKWHT
ncbi:putative cyclin-dependent serine/threonine-protein kinase DDB_G0272797/DDB_G0274007 [Ooceraea biroi]|uniref:putative cyclin-dependent serine/threonine-protein kinase DDB_G0272797/DDB_G0274007 n=1 Tax=Ooceraea biroi TaxID=2015173 RepID=UPI0005BE05CF|nr:putative cyclin-dependent serine/threonine-protein kinase DDB_G0272797/DDB_G0274007 [Ooceraea biroi]